MFQPKLGASLHTLSSELNDGVLQAVSRSRIATLEIFPTLFQGDEQGARKAALMEMLRRVGIRPMTIHALFGGAYDISVLDAKAQDRAISAAAAAVDLAVELGAPMVVMHASAEPIPPQERGRRFQSAQQALAEIGRLAAASGTRIAVEVLPRSCLGNTIEELLALLEGLPRETFGACLDTNHLMDRWQTLPQDIGKLGDRLITTHLSDYDGVDEKHWLPGQGVLPWGEVVAALRAIGYSGPFNYECKVPGDSIEQRVAALEANFAWLSGL